MATSTAPVTLAVGSNLSASQILQGLLTIETGTAPLVIQTFPSTNVFFAFAFAELGTEIALSITSLIASLHAANATPAPAVTA